MNVDPFTNACPLYQRARSLGSNTGPGFEVSGRGIGWVIIQVVSLAAVALAGAVLLTLLRVMA